MTSGVNPLPLDALLTEAARSPDWDRRMVHRCAWCTRVADANNVYRLAQNLHAVTATTDGMCPDCAATALARLTARTRRQSEALAA
jgi:hypothetical protein